MDYTNIRWAPVINCVLKYKDKILIVKRSLKLNFYPGYWNGISGFLDDSRSLKNRIKIEIEEETGISKNNIKSIKVGAIFHQEAPKYSKTWIVHPVLVEVDTDKIITDWEADKFKWVDINDARKYKLLPGFADVIVRVRNL